jgi:hypothetical protein
VDPDPDPHRSATNKNQGNKLDRSRIRINLQMTSQNVWNMIVFEHFFTGLSLYLETRIWIRIRKKQNQNTDPHQRDKTNPDPHQGDADPQYCFL